jgi:hypothetical protein
MKVKRFTLLLVVLAMLAFLPMSVLAQSPTPVVAPDVLNVVMKLMLGFASLAGVSALIAALINLLKVVHVVKDGTSAQWSAGLNLAAFIALVLFGVFRPGLAMDILDGYAGQIAMVILFVLGFIVQITGSAIAHAKLSAANVPLIGKSFST